MKTVRGGKGLGDALYVQAVARHLVARGERIRIATSWPEVFSQLPVEITEFTRQGIHYLAHYSMRKAYPTRQWQDICIQAGVPGAALRLDWRPTTQIGARLRDQAAGRPIVAVQLPRVPMDRKDAFGAELLPDCRTIDRLITMARDRGAFVVQIGAGKPLYRLAGIELDLANATTVSELLDLALEVDAFVGYVSFVVPLAECLDKPALLVWSRRGLRAPHDFVRRITPEKVLEKPTSRAVFDDANEAQLLGAMNELL